MPSHTAAELNRLRAEAEHQRSQADVLLDALPKIQGKVDRAQEGLDTARQQLVEAQDAAQLQHRRASEAERAADEAGAPPHAVPSMTVNATPTP